MTVYSFWQQSLSTPAATARKLLDLWWPGADGVRSTSSSPLLVSAQATPNMSVRVNAGWGKKSGYAGFSDALTTVNLATANASNPRIDLIVMRWRDTEAGDATSSCTVEAITGTPAASPQAPSTAGMIVQILAQVQVAAATTSIAAGAITDQRVVLPQIVEDTNWQNCALGAAATSGSVQVRRIGDQVVFKGSVTKTGGFSPGDALFTLPSSFFSPVGGGATYAPAGNQSSTSSDRSRFGIVASNGGTAVTAWVTGTAITASTMYLNSVSYMAA